jgi:hypothetical protein
MFRFDFYRDDEKNRLDTHEGMNEGEFFWKIIFNLGVKLIFLLLDKKNCFQGTIHLINIRKLNQI